MNAATRQDISAWFDRGVRSGATHMIVVCDTYDHSDFPVYVMPNEGKTAKERFLEEQKKEMQQVMEVYDLRMDKQLQLNETRAFHCD